MDIRKQLDNQSHQLVLVGKIITVLNLVEQHVVIALTLFLGDPAHSNQEKETLFNDLLWDQKVFETFEHKRQFLIRVVRRLARIAAERRIAFPEEQYLDLCKSISDVQEIRNKVAHHYLTYSLEGKAGYHVRKKDGEFLHDKGAGKKGSLKRVEFDLKQELDQSISVYEETEKLLLKDFPRRVRQILYGQE